MCIGLLLISNFYDEERRILLLYKVKVSEHEELRVLSTFS